MHDYEIVDCILVLSILVNRLHRTRQDRAQLFLVYILFLSFTSFFPARLDIYNIPRFFTTSLSQYILKLYKLLENTVRHRVNTGIYLFIQSLNLSAHISIFLLSYYTQEVFLIIGWYEIFCETYFSTLSGVSIWVSWCQDRVISFLSCNQTLSNAKHCYALNVITLNIY